MSQYFVPLVEKPHLHLAKVVESVVGQSSSFEHTRPALFDVISL